MQRFVPALLLAACSAASFASSKVSLIFPDASEKHVFESASWPTKEPGSDTKFSSQKADYTFNSATKTDKIYVIDSTTNKVASKAIGDIKDGTWTLTAADFTAIYKVKVEVTTPKGPVAAATVDLESGGEKRNELIDPSAAGTATFLFLKAGEAKVAVNYKAGGKAQSPVKQVFTISGENASLKVALPDGEAVAPAAGAGTAGNDGAAKSTGKEKDSKDDEKSKENGSPIGSLISTLIGLAFVLGVGYFIIQFMKKNPDQVKGTLTKLGADLPQPGGQNPAVDPIPVAPIAPQPMQQIILDGGAPSPVPGPSAPVSQIQMTAPPAATGIPKLIASDGSAFNLPDGETTVGREFGTGLVVPNDTVSRHHASLIKSGTQVELKDQGSTNGTWINGGKLSGSQVLRPGDSVRFGSVEYRYEG